VRPEEDKAPKGLQAFVKARKGSELWAGLIADAEKRIAWQQGEQQPPVLVPTRTGAALIWEGRW
jgi:hypothetical protein